MLLSDSIVAAQLKLPQFAALQLVPCVATELPNGSDRLSHAMFAEPSLIFCGVPN